jgi:AcrR family transcriptional regulator
MSPRPLKVTDEQLFAATHAVMQRVGPKELTLAAIAEEAGVTAAVLVQRFGSKRALLLELTRQFTEGAGALFPALVETHRSPLAAVRAYVTCMAGMASSRAALARSLAYLQLDLTDPDFRKYLVKQARVTRSGLTGLLQAALDAGELTAGASPPRLARAVEALVTGSMLSWAIHQEGTAAEWMRADVDLLLVPYVARGRRSRKAR